MGCLPHGKVHEFGNGVFVRSRQVEGLLDLGNGLQQFGVDGVEGGLSDKGIGPGGQYLQTSGLLHVGGDDDERQKWPLLPQPAKQLKSVHARHQEIDGHRLRRHLVQMQQGVVPAVRLHHFMAVAAQHSAEALPGILRIVNDKYFHRTSSSYLFLPSRAMLADLQ
ncbi:MAG: hypothetical protein ACD_75C00371G0007 [uncultured bacterium]|nr:MAG: hypothetical protein ACD_75C00371G0007 [uncultured bacterium]